MDAITTYTVSVYTENNVGILNRLSAIFLRRKINIDSFISSESEIDKVYRFIIVVKTTEQDIKRVVGQIEKQIDVIKAYYHTDEETIFMECAIFKIKSDLLFEERQIQNVIKESNATIITVSREFFVLAKTGRRQEIEDLYKKIAVYGIMQFARTGRVSVSKNQMNISKILEEFQEG